MPTTAERHALAFLAAVAVLGGGARAWSHRHEFPSPGATSSNSGDGESPGENVNHQLAAIDSAQASTRRGHGKARSRARVRGAPAIGSPAGEHRYGQQRGNSSRLTPPVPRGRGEGLRGDDIVVDADVASAAQLELLPHISTALAERIVANRDSLGSFGSLAALGRVRGVGVEIRNDIRNLVVFTGSPRVPPNASAKEQKTVTSRTRKRN